MEAGPKEGGGWLGQLSEKQKAQLKEKPQPKKRAQKRQEPGKTLKDAPTGSGGSSGPKGHKTTEGRPSPKSGGKRLDNRREPDPEGFSKIFGRRTQGSQEQITSTGRNRALQRRGAQEGGS
eukprot:4831093-Heterocapsa_arctica.AAC.1